MRFLVLLSFCFLISACTGSAYKLPVISKNEVIEIEKKLEADDSSLRVYKRSDRNYKNRIAKISSRLQRNSESLCKLAEYEPCRFEVKYSSKDIVNAYAHENYKITVYKGFLKYLKNNDEMAALVAHEMGHHLAKHNQESIKNAQTGAVVSGLATALLLAAANANNSYYNSYQQQQQQDAIQNMMRIGAKVGEMSYSKEQEREADLLATYLLKHAGYNLNKAQGLMYTMAKLTGDKVEGHAALMSTHPPTPERVVAWKKAVEEIKTNKNLLPYSKQTNK